MNELEITITCEECGSGVHVRPTKDATGAECDICKKVTPVSFNEEQLNGVIKDCPCCERKDFYKQKDFNRKIGVGLFVLGAISVPVFIWLEIGFPWIYSVFLGMVVLDILLYFILPLVVVCYKCNTIFRNVSNIEEVHPFNHEMHDRIVYSGHDFQGEQLEH